MPDLQKLEKFLRDLREDVSKCQDRFLYAELMAFHLLKTHPFKYNKIPCDSFVDYVFQVLPTQKNWIKELPIPLFRYLTLKSEAEAAKAGNSKAEARANDKAGRYFTRRPAESYLKEFDGGYSSSSDSQIWTDDEEEELPDDEEEEESGDSEELSEQKVTYESSDEEFFDLLKPDKVKFKHLIAGGGKDATLFVAEFRYRPQLMGKSGVLLIGPPGRCRTNLAHAIAYHARFPFHQISGTCASEMDISNVFKKAKWSVPSFVFVDEIDALEPNVATQLGTYMDPATYIIVIGATDKPYAVHDTLRFDHKVSFSIPDASISKVEILSFHKPSANMAKVEVATKEVGEVSGSSKQAG